MYESKIEMNDNRYASVIIGDIIASMRFIETIIDDFITRHYIEDNTKIAMFKYQILDQSFFSFELKIRIFKSILSQDYTDIKFPKNLQELQEIRNTVVHGEMIFTSKQEGSLEFARIRHARKSHNFIELVNRFVEIRDPVVKQLSQLPKIDVETNDQGIQIINVNVHIPSKDTKKD